MEFAVKFFLQRARECFLNTLLYFCVWLIYLGFVHFDNDICNDNFLIILIYNDILFGRLKIWTLGCKVCESIIEYHSKSRCFKLLYIDQIIDLQSHTHTHIYINIYSQIHIISVQILRWFGAWDTCWKEWSKGCLNSKPESRIIMSKHTF